MFKGFSFNKNSFFWFLIVVLLSVFSFKSLVRPGYFPMHDDMQVIRVVEMDKCFKDGQIPCRWVPDLGYGYGYPLYNYYGPSSYYVMEVFHLGGFSLIDSIKIEIILTVILSGIGMFLLGRSLWGSLGGLVSAVFYIYSPYRASDIYSRGAMGEINAFIFLPFIFWSTYEFIKQKKQPYLLILSFSIAGLFITHNITSLIFFPFEILWVLFLIWQFKEWKIIKSIILSGILGFFLAGFFILPVIFEKSLAHVETMTYGYFNYLAHFVSLKQLFLSTHWGYGPSIFGPYDDLSFSIGFLHWLIAGLAIVITFLFRSRNRFNLKMLVFLSFVFLLTVFMAHARSTFIWKMIPILAYLQFPWRFLTLAAFFISLMTGAIVGYSHRYVKYIGVSLIFLVVFFNAFYFNPEKWFYITDRDKLTGLAWEKQVTASIFDYLPIYAKAPPDKPAPSVPISLDGDIEILSYTKGTDWQKGEIDVKTDKAKVVLPLFYFPNFNLIVDNKKTAIDYKNDLGLVTFETNKGTHNIYIKLQDTLIRKIGNLASVLSLLAIGFFYVKKAFRKN